MAAGSDVGLHSRLQSVIGDNSARKLHDVFGMDIVDDLLRHYPRRYVTTDRPSDLGAIRPGQHVTVLAEVVEAKNYTYRRKTGSRRQGVRTRVVVTDGRARLSLTFFEQRWRLKHLIPGTIGMFSGEVREFKGALELTHPDMDLLDAGTASSESRLARGLLPIYPATKSVSSWKIEDCVGLCLDALEMLTDPVDEQLRARHELTHINQAFEDIHRPTHTLQWQSAQHRFRFEEAFTTQLVLGRRRREITDSVAVARAAQDEGIRDAFVQRLPFTLTAGQRDVCERISADLSEPHPMHRLLQGDVGSGKTIVALLAMLQVIDAGGQAALLAPTEVLAGQHYRAISDMLGNLGRAGMLDAAEHATRVDLLTGSMPSAHRKDALSGMASGESGLVIGTHALIQDEVEFRDLGLVVVDEQHRFGVEQRSALADRQDISPHVLVMTATPIPRTVAMTVFGDLEVSTLRELPGGRQPVQTTVVPTGEKPQWIERAWQRIGEEVQSGSQAYVVVTRIGDDGESSSQDDPATAALQDLYAELTQGALADLRVGMLHGRMPADDKDEIMGDFAAGNIDVLAATTVVEVGVDVPNATVMVIMDADRFGVSQLHQLRGRIGRGTKPGLCLLVTQSAEDSTARERLDAVADTADGFELAELDVQLRREGDVLGTAQSGVRSSLRMLSVVRDQDVIERARVEARELLSRDPSLDEHPTLLLVVDELDASERGDFLERT